MLAADDQSASERARLMPIDGTQRELAPLGSVECGSQILNFANGEHVLHEGAPLAAVYEILEGVVVLYKSGADGTRQLIGIRFPGDLLAISGRPEHDCSAVVTRFSRLRATPCEVLETRMEHDPALARRLLAACQNELIRTREQLLVVGSRSAIGRVAALLLYVLSRTDSGPAFVLPLSRREMGDYLGLTIETVSRSMTRLQALGVIALARSDEVTILNRARLTALAAGEFGGAARGRMMQ